MADRGRRPGRRARRLAHRLRGHRAAPADRRGVAGLAGVGDPPRRRTAGARAEAAAAPCPPRDGGAAGFLSGLLGIGGGMRDRPLLAGWLGMPLKRALGTSLLAIVALVVPGIVVHAVLDHIDVGIALALTLGAVPGARVGAAAALGARERTLRLVVGGGLLAVAIGYAVEQVVTMRAERRADTMVPSMRASAIRLLPCSPRSSWCSRPRRGPRPGARGRAPAPGADGVDDAGAVARPHGADRERRGASSPTRSFGGSSDRRSTRASSTRPRSRRSVVRGRRRREPPADLARVPRPR